MDTKDIIERIKEIESIKCRSLEHKKLKLYEEFGELCGAYLSYIQSVGSEYKQKNREDIIEETVDVILCTLSLISNDINKIIKYHFDFLFHKYVFKLNLAVCFEGLIIDFKNDNFFDLLFSCDHLLQVLQAIPQEFEKIVNKKLEKWKNNLLKGDDNAI